MNKTCKRCKINKPRSDFYAHISMKEGVLNFCKDCVKARVRNRRKAARDQYCAYDKKRNATAKRIAARRAYKQTPAGKIAMVKSRAKWAARNPQGILAQQLVNNAIRDGKLKKQPCKVCGAMRNVQAHHPDYSKPFKIKWLCPTHHGVEHGWVT